MKDEVIIFLMEAFMVLIEDPICAVLLSMIYIAVCIPLAFKVLIIEKRKYTRAKAYHVREVLKERLDEYGGDTFLEDLKENNGGIRYYPLTRFVTLLTLTTINALYEEKIF